MYKSIVLIGSGDYRKKECFNIDKKIVDMIGINANLLIVPFAISDKEKRKKRFSAIKEVYFDLGLTKVEILDEESLSISEMKNKINNSDAIYLSGGDPKKLLNFLEKNGLKNSIINFHGIIIGFSAGAMVLPKEGIILGGLDDTYPKTTFFEGLGLINFNISPYYTDYQDKELLLLSKNRQIYALGNASAIVLSKRKMNFIGQVYSFNAGIKNHENLL